MKNENFAKQIKDVLSKNSVSLTCLINETYSRFIDENYVFSDEKYSNCLSELEIVFEKEYCIHEKAIANAIKKYLSNKVIEDVFTKVVMINCLYSSGLYTFGSNDHISVAEMAEHIVQLEKTLALSQAINKGDLGIVDEIANINGKHATSFASKYCSWHNLDRFPVFDSRVRGFMYYWYKDSTEAIKYTQDELKVYGCFAKAVEQFREQNCKDVSYKKLDVFMWLIAKNNNIALY